MRALWQAVQETAKLFSSQRKLWLPFIVTAATEAMLLGLIWLAPHPPFSTVLAPPIQYFFTERMLHYPWHLWFLYHAMKHTNVAASIIAGAFMTGIACGMVRQAHDGQPLSLRGVLLSKRVRYSRVVILWVITWVLAKGMLELLGEYAPKAPWVLFAALALGILLQACLIYVIPAAVYDGLSWWRSLWRGVVEALRYPFSTLILVAIPSLWIMAFVLVCNERRVMLLMRETPEIALLFVTSRFILWLLTDGLLTVAIAHLWCIHRAAEHATAPVRPTPKPLTGPAVALLAG